MKIQLRNKATLINKVDGIDLPSLYIEDLLRIFGVNENIFKKISKGESIKAENLGYADPYRYGLGSLQK